MAHPITKANINLVQYQDQFNNKIRNLENQDKGLYWFNFQKNLHLVFSKNLIIFTIEKSLYKRYAQTNLYHNPYSLEPYKRKPMSQILILNNLVANPDQDQNLR